jgi:hypothetical protein
MAVFNTIFLTANRMDKIASAHQCSQYLSAQKATSAC